MDVHVVEDHIQYVHARISSLQCKEEIMLTAVYGSCHIPTRRMLWDGLQNMSGTAMPWIVMGDFNTIFGHSEQVGCKAIDPKALEDFNDCILNCRLEDAGCKGLSFSWTNRRVAKRLHRVLMNQAYGELFPFVRVTQLAKTLLEHAPLLVESCRPSSGPKGFFKFQEMWFRHERFTLAVEENWKMRAYGDPLFSLVFKLKRIKTFLKKWNKENFGNIFF
ncbi:hypothetical protein LIER_34818 [Lithospermum erythrorhizon]|uniref:Exo_endo_phos domain-containing protein n=1 Tax=Lithospermum erythrorhizon TaxID=34254 RepID=A0AAV3S3A0_LITER